MICWREEERKSHELLDYTAVLYHLLLQKIFFTVPVQLHPTTSRHFDSFHGFSQPSLCLKVSSTYLPFPHFAHNWHSLSSAAFGGVFFVCVCSRSDAVSILLSLRSQSKPLLFTWTGSPHLEIKKRCRATLWRMRSTAGVDEKGAKSEIAY